jgi:lambda family phage portal protein
MGIFDIFKNTPPTKERIIKRQYAAVNQGRLFADFTASERSADSELRPALKQLRNRSRDLAINNEYVKRYFELLKVNVVGEKGVFLQSKALDSVGNLDQSGNDSVESAFKMWGKFGNPTVDGKMSWIDCQKLAVELLAKDGEAFILMHRGAEFHDSFAIQFIESDQIDEQLNKRLDGEREIRMGVELNKFKKPIAYHVLTYHPGDYDYTTQKKSPKHVRVPAEKMIHLFKQLRPGQTRGEPWLAPAIPAIKQLGAFREAAVINARVGASKMGFFTTQGGDGFVADDYDGATPIMSAEPGTFHSLPQGVSFESFNPQFPSNDFDAFHKSILKGIASALGVSYTSLSNDLEATSYSSIRQGALEERDMYKNMISFFIEHFVRRIYDQWLGAAMEIDSFGIPLSQYNKFSLAAEFRGRGWSWVDPQKEMTAAVTGLQNGILSLSHVASQYGMDSEELLSQIARDKQLAQQFGVEYAIEPYGATRQEEEPEEVDDGERGLNEALAESLKRCFVED